MVWLLKPRGVKKVLGGRLNGMHTMNGMPKAFKATNQLYDFILLHQEKSKGRRKAGRFAKSFTPSTPSSRCRGAALVVFRAAKWKGNGPGDLAVGCHLRWVPTLGKRFGHLFRGFLSVGFLGFFGDVLSHSHLLCVVLLDPVTCSQHT